MQRNVSLWSFCFLLLRFLLALILVLNTIILAIYIVTTLPLQENIPSGASCSAIISAACHPLDTNTDADLK